ncbi:MAG: hypothetical protein ACTSRU_05785, partial [Candidatus Hodarchaeales archaeon]
MSDNVKNNESFKEVLESIRDRPLRLLLTLGTLGKNGSRILYYIMFGVDSSGWFNPIDQKKVSRAGPDRSGTQSRVYRNIPPTAKQIAEDLNISHSTVTSTLN